MNFSLLPGRFLAFAGLLLCLILQAGKTNATHLMGGTLTYSPNPNGTYHIKLNLYFDQVNGSPGARDDSVLISGFDAATGVEYYKFW